MVRAYMGYIDKCFPSYRKEIKMASSVPSTILGYRVNFSFLSLIKPGFKYHLRGTHLGAFFLSEVAGRSGGFECEMGIFHEIFPQIHQNHV